MEKVEIALQRIAEAILSRLPNLLLAFVTLVAGAWLIKLVLSIVRNRFERNNVDRSLRDFIISIVKFVLYTMLILSAASMVGIQTTSFVAVLGAASLSIGLALQGSLSNFAGGVLILIFRPFRVGDFISSSVGDASGTVERIDILYTTLVTAEGISVFAPNGPLANSVIRNFSNISKRRFEYSIRITSDSDISRAREAILTVLRSDPRILKTPGPEVHAGELADNAVHLIIRGWTAKENYLEVYYAKLADIRQALEGLVTIINVSGKMNPDEAG